MITLELQGILVAVVFCETCQLADLLIQVVVLDDAESAEHNQDDSNRCYELDHDGVNSF